MKKNYRGIGFYIGLVLIVILVWYLLGNSQPGAALLTLWVKCVSAERGRGSKSRVHFLGYSLFRVWVTVWVSN